MQQFKIGENIKEIRKKAGFSQSIIANYLQIDQSLLSRIENGQRSANISIIEKLSVLFGCSKKVLIEGNQTKECMIMALKNNNLSVEDLHAVAAVNKIALNLRRMQQLLQIN